MGSSFLYILFIVIIVLYCNTDIDRLSDDAADHDKSNESAMQSKIRITDPLKYKAANHAVTTLHNINNLDQHKEIVFFKDILLNSGDIDERIDAIVRLEDIGGKESASALESALGDANTKVRSLAVDALSRLDKEHSVHLLGEILLSDYEQELKLQAVDILSENISPAGYYLLHYVATHSNDEVIQKRARAIAGYYDPIKDVDLFSKDGANKGSDDDLQADGHLATEKNVESLQRVMTNSTYSVVREEAVLALADIGDEAAFSVIEKALGDPSSDVRFRAIEAITNRERERLPVLAQVLFNDPDPELRLESADLIASENNPASIAILEQALTDPDIQVREAIADYLQKLRRR